MQGIGVAIAPSGLNYLVEQLLGAEIAAALKQQLSVPDSQLKVPSWSEAMSDGSYEYSDYELNLTNGTFKAFDPAYRSLQQQQDQFTITMSSPNTVFSYGWRETYQESFHGQISTGPDPHDNSYPYDHTFPDFKISVTFKLAYADGAYTLSYVTSAADPGTDNASIPSDSVLQTQVSAGCFQTKVSQDTESHIKSIDFGSKVQSALAPVFATIAGTGKLGDVTFEFSPGAGGFLFPAGGGLQVGVSGDVVAGGTAWSSTVKAPGDVVLPAIPTTQQIAYNIQDYEFDAQLWGFYRAGALAVTLHPGDISNSTALQTNTYRGTSLNVLATTYPNHSMAAALHASAAPTVTFGVIYELTAAVIGQIQTALTQQHVWTDDMGAALGDLVNSVYVTQAGFSTALSNASSTLAPYVSTIEQHAGAPGVVVDQDVQCVLSVLQQTNAIPVITFDVAQQFVMQNVRLGVADGDIQSLTFAFAEPSDGALATTFVSSTLPGVNEAQWGNVWMALSSSWEQTLTAAGQRGVPLPRISGFHLLAEQATVTINPPQGGADGYASVVADVKYLA